jgi:hypothetical protein
MLGSNTGVFRVPSSYLQAVRVGQHPRAPSACVMLLILVGSAWQDSFESYGRITFYQVAT